MCGRYSLTAGLSDLERLDWYDELLSDHEPRYNIAPSQKAPVIARNAKGVRGLLDMRWGLVPFWADDEKMGNRLINARAETVHSKPAFREAFNSRRCLVLADGFYEWAEQKGGSKQPYWIHRPDDSIFAFAGLWESWKEEEDDEPLLTFTILTRDATKGLHAVHERMPMVLDEKGREKWLKEDAATDDLKGMLGRDPSVSLELRPAPPGSTLHALSIALEHGGQGGIIDPWAGLPPVFSAPMVPDSPDPRGEGP